MTSEITILKEYYDLFPLPSKTFMQADHEYRDALYKSYSFKVYLLNYRWRELASEFKKSLNLN